MAVVGTGPMGLTGGVKFWDKGFKKGARAVCGLYPLKISEIFEGTFGIAMFLKLISITACD